METTTKTRRDHLLSLPIPKGGTRLDAGGDWVWVLKPINIDVWTMALKVARTQSSIRAALMVVDALKMDDCPATKEIPETSVGLMVALQDQVNDLVDEVSIDVKKN